MSDFIKLLAAGLTAAVNDDYETRCVGRQVVDGLVVSTAYTDDCGYETAILDVNEARPVERYTTKEDALAGHARWVEKVVGLTEVTRLGYGDSIPDEVFKLERM